MIEHYLNRRLFSLAAVGLLAACQSLAWGQEAPKDAPKDTAPKPAVQPAAPAAELTDKQLDLDAAEIDRLLALEVPDTEKALSIIMPYFGETRLDHQSKYQFLKVADKVAKAMTGVGQKVDIYQKSITLTKGLTEASDKDVPPPFKMRARSEQARVNYELGRIWHEQAASVTDLEKRKEELTRSDQALDACIELCRLNTTFDEATTQYVWEEIDRKLDELKVTNIPEDKSPEDMLPKAEKEKIQLLWAAIEQSRAEGTLYTGRCHFYKAQNRTEETEANPLPKLRKDFTDSAALANKAGAFGVEKGQFGGVGSQALAPFLMYTAVPGMLPTSAFQAEMGQAVESFRRFGKDYPQEHIAFLGWFWEGQALFELGRHKEAIDILAKVIKYGTPEKCVQNPSLSDAVRISLLRTAEAYYEIPDPEKGGNAYDEMLKRYPVEGDAMLHKKVFDFKSKAKRLYKLKEESGGNAQLRGEVETLLGEMKPMLGDIDVGVNLFETVRKLLQTADLLRSPERTPEIQFALGYQAQNGGNYLEAAGYLKTALETVDQLKIEDKAKRDKFAVVVVDQLVYSYLKMDPPDYGQAAVVIEAAIKRAPNDDDKAFFVHKKMGLWAQKFKREPNDAEARRHFEEAMKELVGNFPQNKLAAQAQFMLAESRRGEGDRLLAEAEQAIVINKDKGSEMRKKALEEYQGAIDLYKNIREENPYWTRAKVMLGFTAESLGRYLVDFNAPDAEKQKADLKALANEAYRDSFDTQRKRVNPDGARQWQIDGGIRYATAQFEEGKFKDAEITLTIVKALGEMPDTEKARILSLEGDIARENNDLEKAAALLDEYRKLDPNTAVVGYKLRKIGHELTRKLKQLEDQYKKEPANDKLKKEIEALRPKAVNMLYEGFKINPFPKIDQERGLAVMDDLSYARANKEAFEVGKAMIPHKEGFSTNQYQHIQLITGKAGVDSRDLQMVTEGVKFLEESGNKHVTVVKLRAEGMTFIIEKSADKNQLKATATDAVKLWENFIKQSKTQQDEFLGAYYKLKILWEMGKTQADFKQQAVKYADDIDLKFPTRNYKDAAPEISAALLELISNVKPKAGN